MDENTFQRELIQLKTRVSQMAMQMASTVHRPYSFPRTMPVPNDAFLDHLQDVKIRLQSMQNSLNHMNAKRDSPTGVNVSHDTTMPTDSALPSPDGNFLPSGPLFWRLFTSLQTDVSGLRTRVADLEQNVSDLEDHVDRLDPNRLTPPASDAEITPYPHWEHIYAQPSYGFNYAPEHRPENLANLNDFWYPGHVQKPSELDTEIASATRAPCQTPAGRMFNRPQNFCGSPKHTSSTPPAGVAFRDREIAQLEELMRAAQEDLRRSEELVSRKDDELAHQHCQILNYDARVRELEMTLAEREAALSSYSQILSQRQSEIDSLRASCQAKDAEIVNWTVKHDQLGTSYLRKRNQLNSADQQIKHMQQSLDNLQYKQDEMDEVFAGKEDEMRRMRDFCDSKDAVIYRQEQIIARGATLMQERDEEIERHSGELQVVKDDLEDERRQKQRFSRLFDERGETISQLRTSLNQALTPISMQSKNDTEATEDESRDEHRADVTYSPFATCGLEAHSQKWTPKAFKGYTRLAHEQRRAVSWENGRRFGEPSPLGLASSHFAQPAKESRTKDLRRSDSLKLLQRLALDDGRTSPNNVTEAEPSTSRQRRLPLEDLSSRPPLPAPLPLPPRRLSSVADLTRKPDDAGSDCHKPISKHHSMLELPQSRHSLQAYVEEG